MTEENILRMTEEKILRMTKNPQDDKKSSG